MKLSELFLNRYLYRDNGQDPETKGSAFVSADSSPGAVASIPSGGAAQDINTGNVQIDGAQIEDGTIPQTTLDVSNWGWGQTCVFTSASLNTVTWGAGTFTSASGVAYSISGGTTGAMAAKTYIYLDLNTSDTAYQITTTSSDSVGIGKVLIAVAENAADSATYNLSEATQIIGDNILANTIDASKIVTGSLVVGTDVQLGTAEDSAGVTAIVGNTITTGYINALSITVLGAVTAGSLTGLTVTGGLIQTDSAANTGIKMSSGSNGFKIYGQYATWYSGSTAVGQIYASSSSNLRIYSYTGKALEIGSGTSISVNGGGGNLELRTGNVARIRVAYTGTYGGFVGTSSKVFTNMYATTFYFARSGRTTQYIQMAAGTNTLETNGSFFIGGTLSKAAGSFRIDHPLKPDTHYLQHSFVESPEMLNIYTGNGMLVNGLCEIQMPDWFIALNGEKDFTYQLTPYGQNSLCIAEEMNKEGKVTFAGTRDGKFSYLITAVRHDKYAEENRIEVELEKTLDRDKNKKK